jgi:hypothetical protein
VLGGGDRSLSRRRRERLATHLLPDGFPRPGFLGGLRFLGVCCGISFTAFLISPSAAAAMRSNRPSTSEVADPSRLSTDAGMLATRWAKTSCFRWMVRMLTSG